MTSSPPILSVSDLTFAVKKKLELSFASLSVRGEVSNLRKQASGHIYFTLKDANSQLSAVLFRGAASRLSRLPKEGDELVARGSLSVYSPRGTYQLIIKEVEYAGSGPLLQRLHELKIKLQGMGWFDKEKKQPLPKFPKTIGVVTSPTGSVIQDILYVLNRRYSGFHLILNPVRVQGDGAAAEITSAINQFNRHALCDVLIVGRGGGSLEDLWPFNEVCVAEAIHQSKIPIVSAVGHETDFTIADFVADMRAPTPSTAAEIVSENTAEHLMRLSKLKSGLLQTLRAQVRSSKQRLEALMKQPLISSPYALLGVHQQKLDMIQDDLTQGIKQVLVKSKMQVEGARRQKEALKPTATLNLLKQNFAKSRREITRAYLEQVQVRKTKLDQLIKLSRALDPRNVLERGYSIAFHEKNDSVILSKDEVQVGESLRVRFFDGELIVQTTEKK